MDYDAQFDAEFDGPVYREPTLADFEDAFDTLITAYIDQKRNPIGAKRLYLKTCMTLAEIPPEAKARVLDMLENPLSHALRTEIKALAQLFHDFLKHEVKVDDPLREMSDALHNIAARDPEQEGRRGAVLDKIWDGIGDGKWNWMA